MRLVCLWPRCPESLVFRPGFAFLEPLRLARTRADLFSVGRRSGMFRPRAARFPPRRLQLRDRLMASDIIAVLRAGGSRAGRFVQVRGGLSVWLGLSANIQEREEQVQHTTHSATGSLAYNAEAWRTNPGLVLQLHLCCRHGPLLGECGRGGASMSVAVWSGSLVAWERELV